MAFTPGPFGLRDSRPLRPLLRPLTAQRTSSASLLGGQDAQNPRQSLRLPPPWEIVGNNADFLLRLPGEWYSTVVVQRGLAWRAPILSNRGLGAAPAGRRFTCFRRSREVTMGLMLGLRCGCGCSSRARRRCRAVGGMEPLESRRLLAVTLYVDASAPGPSHDGSSWGRSLHGFAAGPAARGFRRHHPRRPRHVSADQHPRPFVPSCRWRQHPGRLCRVQRAQSRCPRHRPVRHQPLRQRHGAGRGGPRQRVVGHSRWLYHLRPDHVGRRGDCIAPREVPPSATAPFRAVRPPMAPAPGARTQRPASSTAPSRATARPAPAAPSTPTTPTA